MTHYSEGWIYDPQSGQRHPDYGEIVRVERRGASVGGGSLTCYINLDGEWFGKFDGWADAQYFAWVTDGGKNDFPPMTEEDIEAACVPGHRWYMPDPPKGDGLCGYCTSEVTGPWIYMPESSGKLQVRCSRCYMIARLKSVDAWERRRAG